MIDMLLALVLLACFAVINRWAHQRDLAAAERWGREQADAAWIAEHGALPDDRDAPSEKSSPRI